MECTPESIVDDECTLSETARGTATAQQQFVDLFHIITGA